MPESKSVFRAPRGAWVVSDKPLDFNPMQGAPAASGQAGQWVIGDIPLDFEPVHEAQPTPFEANAPKEQPGMWSGEAIKNSLMPYVEAGRGLVAGSAQLGQAAGAGMQYLGNRLGLESVARGGEKLAGVYEKQAEAFAAPQELQGSVWDNPKLLANASWWAYNTAQMAPSLAAAILPGAGAAKAIQVGGKAIQLSPQVIARLATLGQAAGAGAAGGAMEGASTYREVMKQGGSEGEAARAAELMGAGSAALNAISFGKMLGKAGGSTLAKVGKHAAAGATEAITEGAEEPWEELSKGVARYLETGEFDPATWGNMVQAVKERSLNVAGPAALVGAGGSVMSGGEAQAKQPDQAPIIIRQESPLPLTDIREIGAERQGLQPPAPTAPVQPAPIPVVESEVIPAQGVLDRADAYQRTPAEPKGLLPRVEEQRSAIQPVRLVPVEGNPFEGEAVVPPFDLDAARREGAQREYLEQPAAPAPELTGLEPPIPGYGPASRNLPVPSRAIPQEAAPGGEFPTSPDAFLRTSPEVVPGLPGRLPAPRDFGRTWGLELPPGTQDFELVPEGMRRDLPVPSRAVPLPSGPVPVPEERLNKMTAPALRRVGRGLGLGDEVSKMGKPELVPAIMAAQGTQEMPTPQAEPATIPQEMPAVQSTFEDQPAVTLRADGKPWARQDIADKAAKRLERKTGTPHEPVNVGDGWGVRPVSAREMPAIRPENAREMPAVPDLPARSEEARRPALARTDKINGVTVEEAGRMMANGDPAVIEHVKDAVKEHGPMQAQGAIRNEALRQVAEAPKGTERDRVRQNIASVEPAVNGALKEMPPTAPSVPHEPVSAPAPAEGAATGEKAQPRERILSISDTPQKSNSSYGNWAVETEIAVPIGSGRTRKTEFFFKKSDAIKFIREQKAALTAPVVRTTIQQGVSDEQARAAQEARPDAGAEEGTSGEGQGVREPSPEEVQAARQDILAAALNEFSQDGTVDFDRFALLVERAIEDNRLTFEQALEFYDDSRDIITGIEDSPVTDAEEIFGPIERSKWFADYLIDDERRRVSRGEESAAAEMLRDTELGRYDEIIGYIRKRGGLKTDWVRTFHGKGVVEDLQSKFGWDFVSSKGVQPDAIAGDFGFTDDQGLADGQALVEYLQDAPNKKQIEAEYRRRKRPAPPEGEGRASRVASSRATTPTTGLPASEVKAVIEPFLRLAGDNAAPTMVVQSVSDMPAAAQTAYRREAEKGEGRIRAFFHGGTTYLIGDEISDKADALEGWKHEEAGHYGTRVLFPKERQWRNAMTAAYEGMSNSDRNRIADLYGVKRHDAQGKILIGDEYIASLAEKVSLDEALAPREKTLWQRFVNLLRVAWQRMFGGTSKVPALSDRQIAAIVKDAARVAMTGRDSGEAKAIYRETFGEPVLAKGAAVEDEGIASRGAQPRDEGGKFSRTGDAGIDAAIAKIGRPQESLSTRVQNVWRDLKTNAANEIQAGLFDHFYGLKLLDAETEQTLGVKLPTEEKSYIATRMSTGLPDIMETVLLHGVPVWKEGAVTVGTRDKGLLKILEPLGKDLDLFFDYRVGVRADRLMQEGRENYFTKEDIANLKKLAPKDEKGKALWRKVWREYSDYNRKILDFAQASGVINAESRQIWEKDDHIPFYRITEDEGVKGPRGKKGIASQRSGIRTLTGGESRIGDPMGNAILNFTHLIDASIKNRAADLAMQKAEALGSATKAGNQFEMHKVQAGQMATRLRKILEQDGVSLPKLTAEQRTTLASVFFPVAPKGNKVVHVLRDGKPVYYEVGDPLLLRALTAINQQPIGGKLMRLARWFKRVLTQSVTVDPAFMAANIMRDTISTWVVTDGKFIPVVDSAKGAVKAWREDSDFIELQAAGGTFSAGYLYGHDPEATAKNIKRIVAAHGIDENTILNSPKRLWNFWKKVGAAGENAARVAKFSNVRKSGGTLLEAAYEAKDVMDFSMRGDWRAVQFLTQVVPFLGARIQGLHKLGRGFADNPKGFTIKGGAIMAASLLLYLYNRDDDRYKQLEEWDKDNYYHIWLGDEHFRLPKPFEVGAIFGTLPERFTERFLDEHGNNKLLMERIRFMLTQTLAVDFPQMVGPVIEQWANKSAFTGRPIVGQSLERLAPKEQRYPWTSETASEIGKALNFSPLRVQHLIQGYFGTLGMYALGASDVVTRRMTDYPELPTQRMNDMPVLRRFWRGEDEAPRTKYATAMYDVFREIDELTATVNYYRRTGDAKKAQELLSQERDKAKYKQYLNEVQSRTQEIDRVVKQVYASRTMSPDAKRDRLDALTNQKNKILRGAYEKVYQSFSR